MIIARCRSPIGVSLSKKSLSPEQDNCGSEYVLYCVVIKQNIPYCVQPVSYRLGVFLCIPRCRSPPTVQIPSKNLNGGLSMLDNKSDYALNKKDQDSIVYSGTKGVRT